MKPLKLVSALAVLLAACAASPSGSNPPPPNGSINGNGPSKRVFGTVEFYGEPARVEVPISVRQGQPFVVTVVTYGGGCIEKGEATVTVEALRAEVRPYNHDTSTPQRDCDDMLRTYEHSVTLSFEETGTAEIVFLGQKEDSSTTTQTSVTRTLEVC